MLDGGSDLHVVSEFLMLRDTRGTCSKVDRFSSFAWRIDSGLTKLPEDVPVVDCTLVTLAQKCGISLEFVTSVNWS